MSGKKWMKLGLIAGFVALALPAGAAAETCSCYPNPVYFLDQTVYGTSCTALGSQLVYYLNTTSDADCVNRGYSRSCLDQISLDSCKLSGGQLERYGVISYSCAICTPDPDQGN